MRAERFCICNVLALPSDAWTPLFSLDTRLTWMSVSTETFPAKTFGEGYVSAVCQTPSSRTWCR